MKSQWHFPLINPRKHYSLKHYLDHIMEEIREFSEESDPELKRKEAVDILHAAETFVRKYFQRTSGKKFKDVKKAIVKKNRQHGYYQK